MDRSAAVTPVDPYDPYLNRDRRRISWGAVLAGTVVAIMVMMLINLLTLGFGLRSIDPATEAQPFAGLGTGTTIGMIIANVLALFLGGWVAGRLAGEVRGLEGAMHGLLTWGLVTLFSVWLLTTAVGRLVGGVASVVGQGLSLAGQGVAALAPEAAQAVEDALANQGVDLESIRQEATEVLGQVSQVPPEEAADEAAEAGQDIVQNPQAAGRRVDRLITQVFGANPAQDVDRSDLEAALVESGMTPEEAEQTVTNWQQVADEAQQRIEAAREELEVAAQEATDTIGNAAIWAFFGLLLGAIIAMVGSAAGRPKTVAEARAH